MILARLDSLEVTTSIWSQCDRYDVFPVDDPPPSLPILWRVVVEITDHLHTGDKALSTSSVPFGQHLLIQLYLTPERELPTSVYWERFYIEIRRVVALHEHARLRLVLVAGAPWRRPEATVAELAAIKALEGDCAQRGVVLRSCELPSLEDGAMAEFIEFLREEATSAAAEGA
ncbi:hypothetical protein JCM8208_004388 [Rhodotorula glutinis]